MPLLTPTIRASFTSEDAAAIDAGIARLDRASATRLGRLLTTAGIDAVVTDPAFEPEVVWPRHSLTAVRLPVFLYVSIARAFAEAAHASAGVRAVPASHAPDISPAFDAPIVIDYVTSLVLAFGDHDRSGTPAGARTPLPTLADLMTAVDAESPGAAQHLGNVALWTGGCFASHVEARVARRGAPGLSYVEAIGQRGYTLAMQDAAIRHAGLGALCESLARHFPRIRSTLSMVVAQGWWAPRATDAASVLDDASTVHAWLDAHSRANDGRGAPDDQGWDDSRPGDL